MQETPNKRVAEGIRGTSEETQCTLHCRFESLYIVAAVRPDKVVSFPFQAFSKLMRVGGHYSLWLKP